MISAVPDIGEEYEALVQFVYLAPVGLVQANLEGEIAMINPLSAQLLIPLSPDGNLTNLFQVLETVAPDLRNLVESCSAPHGMVCDGVRIPLRGGNRAKSQPAMLSLTLLKLDQRRLMAVINDITQQVARERMLQQNEAWLNAIMVGVTDYALVRLDSSGCVYDWNASIGRITGFSEKNVVGKPFSVFYPDGGTTVDRITDRLREADESGWSLDEGWRLKADGSRFWGSAMITPLALRNEKVAEGWSKCADERTLDVASPAYSLVVRDITDKHEANEVQRKAIACDHLTGIGNRRSFFEAAELEFLRGRRLPRKLSLLMLDIDHFKKVNDGHGHPAGDAVLREFAALLTASFREVDVVCRVGGEEFAVLMPSADLAQAQAGAERLRHRAEMHAVVVDGTTIHYTVSGGIASVDSDLADLDVLMKRADTALYVAKAEGRNRVSYWRPADSMRINALPMQP